MYNDKVIKEKDGRIHSKSFGFLVFGRKEQDSVGNHYMGTGTAC